MKNRVVVYVAGQEYKLVTEEPEDYVRKLALQLHDEIADIVSTAHLSISHATVLAALNGADRARKATDLADHLRTQVKDYLDETQKLKGELAEARREISRLKKHG